ncbi:hypothetical protein [Cohnella sp. REN36]|uniref:hypothetical protein n=1 Tax=Cohnella sp. REN36 TaxID=2887347 RepID=UPI001D14ED12|nr:hypothetical protein [Cohnella sp. REN36]MCC3373160.1 hypothetical protein [Cohnella sp. REN36]
MLEHQHWIEKLAEYREATYKGRNPLAEAEKSAEGRVPSSPRRKGAWMAGIVWFGIGGKRIR